MTQAALSSTVFPAAAPTLIEILNAQPYTHVPRGIKSTARNKCLNSTHKAIREYLFVKGCLDDYQPIPLKFFIEDLEIPERTLRRYLRDLEARGIIETIQTYMHCSFYKIIISDDDKARIQAIPARKKNARPITSQGGPIWPPLNSSSSSSKTKKKIQGASAHGPAAAHLEEKSEKSPLNIIAATLRPVSDLPLPSLTKEQWEASEEARRVFMKSDLVKSVKKPLGWTNKIFDSRKPEHWREQKPIKQVEKTVTKKEAYAFVRSLGCRVEPVDFEKGDDVLAVVSVGVRR